MRETRIESTEWVAGIQGGRPNASHQVTTRRHFPPHSRENTGNQRTQEYRDSPCSQHDRSAPVLSFARSLQPWGLLPRLSHRATARTCSDSPIPPACIALTTSTERSTSTASSSSRSAPTSARALRATSLPKGGP